MLRISKVLGITLIELLITLVIMMTTLSLVGGLAVEAVDKTRAQSEIVSIYGLIKNARARAFVSGKPIRLDFQAEHLDVYSDKDLILQKNFEHLSFDPQTISFNRNGSANSTELEVIVRGNIRRLDLLIKQAKVEERASL